MHEQQWAGMKNRELLTRAEAAGFEAFLTADQNVGLQQNLAESGLRIVLVHDRSNALEDLLLLVPELLAVIENTTPGQVVRVPKRELGVVCAFSDRDGRGEIKCDRTGDLLFVPFSQVRADGFRALATGDRVEFTRVEMPEGPYASDVVKLSDPSG